MAQFRQAVSTGSMPAEPLSRTARKGRKFRFRYVLMFGTLIWASYYYSNVEKPQLETLNLKQAQLNQQIKAMQKTHTVLVNREKQLQNKQFITQYATEHFNLVLPGQVTFNVKH